MHLIGLVESPGHVCCRYRLAALRPYLEQAGHRLELCSWPGHWWSRWQLGKQLAGADLVIVQRRLLAFWGLYFLRRWAKRLVFDFDDAVFLRDSYAAAGLHSRRRQRRFAAMVRSADAVSAGNDFLGAAAGKWTLAQCIQVIPTCVEPTRYPLAEHGRTGAGVQLVWVGSASTLRGLERARPLLEALGRRCPGLELKLICDRALSLDALKVVRCPWSEATEAAEIAAADIGISWLPDDDWSRGKCGLKVLQYMAAGLPVVANPVGVQAELVRAGETGFLAETADEWAAAIERLAHQPALRQHLGRAGRQRVENEFSVAVAARRWLQVLESVNCLAPVKVTAGGQRWLVAQGWQERLLGPAGLRLDDWLRHGQATAVKQGPHRTVYRVRLPGLDFYLKHNRLWNLRAWLREWLRPAKALREYRQARAIANRGVATVVPLAVGRAGGSGPGESFLITETLPGTETLFQFLERRFRLLPPAAQTVLRQRLAAELGRFVARLHANGIVHHDFHAGNVLVRWEGDRLELFLIDLHATRLGRPLGWRARRANLAVLNRYFCLRASRTDRLRFWRAYCGLQRLSPGGAPWLHQPARALENASWQSALRFWRQRERRCLATNPHFRQVHSRAALGHVVAELDQHFSAALFADPDAPFRRPRVRVLKDSPSSTVIEFELELGGQSRSVIYKRFRATAWSDPLANLLRRPAALRSWLNGHGFLDRDLPTPRPLAVLHRQRAGLLFDGYLLTEKVPDAVDLHAFLASLAALSDPGRRLMLREVINRVAMLIHQLHRRQLGHRDLKASNVLVQSPNAEVASPDLGLGTFDFRLFLIDLVGVRRSRCLSERRRVQNLARLHASFCRDPALTRSDKLRFLRSYLQWGLRGKSGWKEWWRRIAEATQAKLERNRRKGRPLG